MKDLRVIDYEVGQMYVQEWLEKQIDIQKGRYWIKCDQKSLFNLKFR